MATAKTPAAKKSKPGRAAKAAGKARAAPAKPPAKKARPAASRPAAAKQPASGRSAGAGTAVAARPSAARVPASGPLTLEQARTLASVKRLYQGAPQPLAAAVAGPAAPEPATVRSVARERQRLDKAQGAEIAQRVRDYKAVMTLLKDRGARGPGRGGAGADPLAAAAAGFVPLQVLAEGDSWFHYPPFIRTGGLVPRLERRLGVPILSLATAGDEVRFMLGVKQYRILAGHLRDGCPAGGAWDVLLFSGGGNDIVDNPMALWLKDWNPALPPEAHLNAQRFAAALALVRAGYEDMIVLRDRLSPTTQLVFHGYDFAIPDGRNVCFTGPWLKPAFDLRGFPTREAGAAVVRVMLAEFARLLQSLADSHPKVRFINGQGLLPETTDSWHNELHPSSEGYDRHADNFRAVLKELFPTRVA